MDQYTTHDQVQAVLVECVIVGTALSTICVPWEKTRQKNHGNVEDRNKHFEETINSLVTSEHLRRRDHY